MLEASVDDLGGVVAGVSVVGEREDVVATLG